MKKTGLHIAIWLVLLSSSILQAQENTSQAVIEAIIESQIANIEEGTNAAMIIEDLEELADHPLNINATNATELARLYILNPVQINQLLNFVEEFGPVYSIFELNTIEGFTPDQLQKIQPFIYFGEREKETESFSEALKKGRHEVLARALGILQTAEGFKERDDGTTPYEGNRFRYYSRYRFEARDKLSVGVTAEKDPGEAFFSGSNKQGFDFYSAHASWTPNKTIQQITVGDFSVRSGQGLALWQGYTAGKSQDVLSISKTGQGIRPYTSVDENAFFRGAAASFKTGKHALLVYYSNKNADGNIETDKDGSFYFTSLQTSGYHRTESEIADKQSVKTNDAGGVYTLQLSRLKVGATFSYQHFNMPFVPSDQLYNLFRFSGDENYTASTDYLFSSGRYQLFGEAAISKSGGKAFLQGAVARLNDRLNFSMLYRHFDKNYHALWANTFADGTNSTNNSGLYFGLRFLPAKYMTLSAYSDLYKSNWYSYSTAGPSTGWEVLTQADFRFSENFSFYLRYKNEENDQKYKDEKLYVNLPERTQKIRLHFDYSLSETISLKSRIEHVYFKGNVSENGFLVFQDFQYHSKSNKLSTTARFAYFNTESYDSRIYAYENDLLYTFSVPAFYGKGVRTFLNLHYKITSKLDGWLKFGNTLWTDRETISSGYNEIDGKCKSELKMQLRLKF